MLGGPNGRGTCVPGDTKSRGKVLCDPSSVTASRVSFGIREVVSVVTQEAFSVVEGELCHWTRAGVAPLQIYSPKYKTN